MPFFLFFLCLRPIPFSPFRVENTGACFPSGVIWFASRALLPTGCDRSLSARQEHLGVYQCSTKGKNLDATCFFIQRYLALSNHSCLAIECASSTLLNWLKIPVWASPSTPAKTRASALRSVFSRSVLVTVFSSPTIFQSRLRLPYQH